MARVRCPSLHRHRCPSSSSLVIRSMPGLLLCLSFRPQVLSGVPQSPFRTQIFTGTLCVQWSHACSGGPSATHRLREALPQAARQAHERGPTPGVLNLAQDWPPPTDRTSGAGYICDLGFDSPLFFFSQVNYNCRLIVML